MSRNGSGTYVLPAGNPIVTGTTISSSWANTTLDDIKVALTQSIAVDGQTPITANIPFNNHKITGLMAGTALTDAATLSNVIAGAGTYIATVSGSANGIILSANPAITAYAVGQRFSFIAAAANTTAVTVNISGLGAKDLTKTGAIALVANEILAGAIVTIEYDGTQFQLLNPAVLVPVAFPAGTRMSFQQTNAPTGWTKDTTAAINDSILSFVTGSVTPSGGSVAFSTWNAQTSTSAFTLTIAEMPSHNHLSFLGTSSGAAGASSGMLVGAPSLNKDTTYTGGGGAHSHGLTHNVKYYDFIIASRDP